jgi:hypothetical protein
VSATVHPTTALWFATWVGVALAINERSWRMPLVTMGLLAAAGTIGAWLVGLVELHTMDAEWIAVVSDRDYLFPDEWAFSTWTLNLLYPVVIGLTYRARVRAGVAGQAERGVVLGCLALVAVFLCALPLIAARLSVAVQLQVSRVFWMTDVMATLLLLWWLAEAPLARAAQASRLGQRGVGWYRRAMLLAGLIAIVALARGVYVQRVEHPGRPLVQVQLPDDAWSDVSGWLQRTPVDSHVLADPGHAWRYGSSLRVSAHRDVFLEDVKDGSIAMYTRPIAMRVAERRAALGDAGTLSENAIRSLAARYDLDYLVSERAFALPEVYRNPRFHVYRLDRAVPAASH